MFLGPPDHGVSGELVTLWSDLRIKPPTAPAAVPDMALAIVFSEFRSLSSPPHAFRTMPLVTLYLLVKSFHQTFMPNVQLTPKASSQSEPLESRNCAPNNGVCLFED